MSTIYYVASSIDGYIADSNDGIDWLTQFGMEAFADGYERFISGVGAIVMGSATYEFLLAAGPEAWDYRQPCWVLTHRDLPRIEGANLTFTAEPVDELHATLTAAAAGGDVWILGGGDVAAQFAERGLIDELQLTVMPIALGSGKPLLPVGAVTAPLELLGSTALEGGAVESRYRFG